MYTKFANLLLYWLHAQPLFGTWKKNWCVCLHVIVYKGYKFYRLVLVTVSIYSHNLKVWNFPVFFCFLPAILSVMSVHMLLIRYVNLSTVLTNGTIHNFGLFCLTCFKLFALFFNCLACKSVDKLANHILI
jgi:hypothetical protein